MIIKLGQFQVLLATMALSLAVAMAVGAPAKKGPTKTTKKAEPASAAKSGASKDTPMRKFSTVVIDPGHGGHDLGGIPENLMPEKGVALEVATRLRDKLKEEGLITILTRDDDTFVTLKNRVEMANQQAKAIFVSIHFNSGLRPEARGIETYYYSSAHGARLAARIQEKLSATTEGENRGVRTADYFVLKKTKIPAVLVECGFLTNKEDVILAKDDAYLEKLANEICEAIVEFRDTLS